MGLSILKPGRGGSRRGDLSGMLNVAGEVFSKSGLVSEAGEIFWVPTSTNMGVASSSKVPEMVVSGIWVSSAQFFSRLFCLLLRAI